MLKADIGDYIYIIIFVVLTVVGGLEKYFKAKRQQQERGPRAPRPAGGGFEDRKEERPQTLEEMVKQIRQASGTSEEEPHPEEARSLETIPTATVGNRYRPAESSVANRSGEKAFAPVRVEDDPEGYAWDGFEFDIRKAVIYSEIMNRKY